MLIGGGGEITHKSVDKGGDELDAEDGGDAEEARQLDVGFAVLDTGNVALLSAEHFGELLLCEV